MSPARRRCSPSDASKATFEPAKSGTIVDLRRFRCHPARIASIFRVHARRKAGVGPCTIRIVGSVVQSAGGGGRQGAAIGVGLFRVVHGYLLRVVVFFSARAMPCAHICGTTPIPAWLLEIFRLPAVDPQTYPQQLWKSRADYYLLVAFFADFCEHRRFAAVGSRCFGTATRV